MEMINREPVEPLSKREAKLLKGCETEIENHQQGFIPVGKALATINNEKLYRIYFESFDEYCQGMWDMSRQRAYQFISAFQVIDNLSTIVDTTIESPQEELSTIVDINSKRPFSILPKNESQARPLAEYNDAPEKQRAIWTLVIDKSTTSGEPITAIMVQQCVAALFSSEVSKKISKVKSLTKKETGLPEYIQQSFTDFFNVVQKVADGEIKEISKPRLTKVLRDLLQTFEQ